VIYQCGGFHSVMASQRLMRCRDLSGASSARTGCRTSTVTAEIEWLPALIGGRVRRCRGRSVDKLESTPFRLSVNQTRTIHQHSSSATWRSVLRKGPFIATQLHSTSSCRRVHSVNNCHLSMNVVTQLTQFVGHYVIHKNTTDLAVRCSTGSIELS